MGVAFVDPSVLPIGGGALGSAIGGVVRQGAGGRAVWHECLGIWRRARSRGGRFRSRLYRPGAWGSGVGVDFGVGEVGGDLFEVVGDCVNALCRLRPRAERSPSRAEEPSARAI